MITVPCTKCCHRCPYATLLQCWSVYFPMSCFETAKELFLHSAQGGTTAPGDVTNAVARHLDATHHHRGLNQKSEELSTGHEQHLSSVSEGPEGHKDTTNHWQNLSWQIHWSSGSCFRTAGGGRCPCFNPMLSYEFVVKSSPAVFL